MASERHTFRTDKATGIAFNEWIRVHAPQLVKEQVWAGLARMVYELDDVEALLAFVGVGTPQERRRFALQALQRIATDQGEIDQTSFPDAYSPDTPEGSAFWRTLREERTRDYEEIIRLMKKEDLPTAGTAGRPDQARGRSTGPSGTKGKTGATPAAKDSARANAPPRRGRSGPDAPGGGPSAA